MAEATKIDLGNNWTVEADPSCWILREKREMKNVKPGNPATYDRASYHPNLESALWAYVDDQLKGIKKHDAHTVLQALTDATVSIRKSLEAHVASKGPLEERNVLDRPIEKERRLKKK